MNKFLISSVGGEKRFASRDPQAPSPSLGTARARPARHRAARRASGSGRGNPTPKWGLRALQAMLDGDPAERRCRRSRSRRCRPSASGAPSCSRRPSARAASATCAACGARRATTRPTTRPTARPAARPATTTSRWSASRTSSTCRTRACTARSTRSRRARTSRAATSASATCAMSFARVRRVGRPLPRVRRGPERGARLEGHARGLRDPFRYSRARRGCGSTRSG